MAGEFHSLPHSNADAFEAPSICAEVITIQYPLEVKNEKAQKKYKNKLFMENQETLFADCHKMGT